MAPHQVFTFIVSGDLAAFDLEIISFNVFVIWFIDCLKTTLLEKNYFFFRYHKICLCSCHRTIIIFGYEMHKNRKPVLVLWNRCTEKIKYEYRKIYSSTLNMKYKAWCPLPIKESSKMWIELLNFPATFILTSDFRISCHYKLSLSFISFQSQVQVHAVPYLIPCTNMCLMGEHLSIYILN